jgi:thioredoxin 1
MTAKEAVTIKPVEINDTQFDTIVLCSPVPVLLVCTSPECIICKTMAERIKEISRETGSQVLFLTLNVNENKRWQDFDVRVIPTLLYFNAGALVARQDNFPETQEIQSQIRALTQK